MELTAIVTSRTAATPLRQPDMAPVGASGGAANAAGTGSVTAAAPGIAEAATPDLKSAIEAGSKALQGINQSLEFQLDPKSKMSVVRVVDTQTNEVIRQFPSEQFLRMVQQLDAFQAHLINDKA